jgi:hypothetical protein
MFVSISKNTHVVIMIIMMFMMIAAISPEAGDGGFIKSQIGPNCPNM